jgi:hypothetical protein
MSNVIKIGENPLHDVMFFTSINERCKCNVMHDEIYIRESCTY